MTVANLKAGEDAVFAPAIAALAALTADHRVDWSPDLGFTEPADGVWARVRMRFAKGGHAAIGNRLFDSAGILSIQINAKEGDGLSTVDDYATPVLNAYRRASITGVRFTNMRPDGDGTGNGAWSQRTILVDFEFTEQI